MLTKMLTFLLPLANGVLAQGGSNSSSSNASAPVDLSWHAPGTTTVNNLTNAVNGTGTYGFVFDSSQLPAGTAYGTYDWCNMPHARRSEYPSPPAAGLRLAFVEVLHRHHKRTPYAANTFPVETYGWSCGDAALFYYGAPLNPAGNASAATYWAVDAGSVNPLTAPGFAGDCEFPQITRGGLDDSWLHGRDLYGVYHDMLGLIPDGDVGDGLPAGVHFRVTNNVITSEVAGMLVNGMFGATRPVPLTVQPDAIDSLEPTYSCPAASALAGTYGPGSSDPTWKAHLDASAGLAAQLDDISGIDPASNDWHRSWDHYFDNLSARQCHAKPLPCRAGDASKCVSQAMADEVYRLGEWEYAWMYRGASQTLAASSASFGIWLAELAQHLRDARAGSKDVGVYRHNVAHDGSVSRLLSVLQIEDMVWPGMGAEVVFELYSKTDDDKQWFVRILWGGQVLKSSTPVIGKADMVPLDTFLAYIDGLVGPKASLVPGKCSSSGS